MSEGPAADDTHVFRPHHPNERDVARRVAKLPLDYFVCKLADHWVVVGPTGIFVVGRSDGDPANSAETTLSLAHRIRAELSELIPWVPFIDALLVGGRDDLSQPCTTVDIGSLEMALLSGPLAIDEIGMVQLRRHVPAVLDRIQASADLTVDPA